MSVLHFIYHHQHHIFNQREKKRFDQIYSIRWPCFEFHDFQVDTVVFNVSVRHSNQSVFLDASPSGCTEKYRCTVCNVKP